MRLRNITLAGIILLILAFVIIPVNAEDNATTNSTTIDANSSDPAATGAVEEELIDDVESDDSMIGPDNVLYKLKLAFEDLDVAFTFNESEKVGKQVSQARHRLAEIKSALKKKNLKAADEAIEQYEEETEKAEESISRIKNKDKGLIKAQAMIAKHQYVLEGLIELNPNNTGLINAHNNSERLLTNFSSKTKIKLERKTDKTGRKTLKHVEIEDDEEDGYEKTRIKAEVENNKTHVKVELKFLTNSTEETDIAADISDRLAAIKDNVSNVIKIERDDEENDENEDDEAEPEVTVTGGPTATLTTNQVTRTVNQPREKLKAQAEVKGNTTRVTFEYTFFLEASEDSAIITGVEDKLSTLTDEKILDVLEVKVDEKKLEKKNERNNVENKHKEEKRNIINDREKSNESEDDD